MRVSIRVDSSTTYWVDCKDRWCREDIVRWREALGHDTDDASVMAVLDLLKGWVTALHVEDVDGHEYTRLDDLTLEVVNRLDAPAYRLLVNLPFKAWSQRSDLGEV